nr:MAG TPA: hypothetical protein [Caudoviricetes sp.]
MLTDIPYNQREGITLGTALDVCKDCAKEGKYKPGDLEYKEVFKIDNFGEPICLCMKHFEQKLGKYILVDSTDLGDDTEETQNESVEEKPAKKTTAKKTTKKEADENVTDGKTAK